MIRRFAASSRGVAAIVAAVAIAVAASGCCERTVKVETGELVVCTYGETVSSSVRTIEVPASKVRDYEVFTRTVTCDKHKSLEALYRAAQEALAAGDLKTAKAKLAQVVAIDATFRKAAGQIAQIDAGKAPKPDSGTGAPGSTPTTGTPGGQPSGPVMSLAVFVPDTLSGYTADPIQADAAALTREYIAPGSAAVRSVVVVAEQYKDAASAKAAASATIASMYPSRKATVPVEGRVLQYGASSTRFAAVAWNEGAILVVIEGYSPSGSSALKTELAEVAAAIIK